MPGRPRLTAPAVVALLADASLERGLAAGFEEEGVPLCCGLANGSSLELARLAAARSLLGLGIGGDAEGLVLVLAAASGQAYLTAPAPAARGFGHMAARVAARRPIET